MKAFYEMFYRYSTPPWGRAPSPDLVDLVDTGRVEPCRVIDIGCGTGVTSIFLASRGFEVTGVDFAPAAVDRARAAAAEAGVTATFVLDDITAPTSIRSGFDLLVDHGTFDDLTVKDRRGYVSTATRIAGARATFYLWCFEWAPTRWERLLTTAVPIGNISVEPGEIQRWFSPSWAVEQFDSSTFEKRWPRRSATYLMRKTG